MSTKLPVPANPKQFSDREFWDKHFKESEGRPFEWYGDWSLISKLVAEKHGMAMKPEDNILVPGCGNSSLSVDIYNAGFYRITNIDFSRVVIAEMLKKHVRSCPLMRWMVMDMTKMKLADDSFDVILDKGGLDAILGEPEDDRSSGVSFLSEVKRVLKPNGRFGCITLAQQHVIELLLSTFRDGWHLSIHGLQLISSNFQAFFVIAKEDRRENLPQVSFDLDLNWHGSENSFQMDGVTSAVDAENAFRSQGLMDAGVNDLCKFDSRDLYESLHPGRMLNVSLHSHRSQFRYEAVIMDTKDVMKPDYQCAVFLVPQGRAHEWLFSSAEGQWQVAEGSKSSRLIMVTLSEAKDHDIRKLKDDLSPLVKCLLTSGCRESDNVPFMTQDDGIAARSILADVHSPMTGAMVVEDVFLGDEEPSRSSSGPVALRAFRRLVFRRNPNLIQSEALLIKRNLQSFAHENGRSCEETTRRHGSKKKKKGVKDFSSDSLPKNGTLEELKVDHSFLASKYHAGMIAAFALISRTLKQWLASNEQIRVLVVGLGAGLLPMFLHNHLPIDDIQVVELDPMVGDVAKRHFDFKEDHRMKLHIGNGIEAVQSISTFVSSSGIHNGIHVIIIDADAEDPSSGLSCPPPEFLEVSFLREARTALMDGGMLIVNVVSRAISHHVESVGRLKEVFEEVYDIRVSEDVNRVIVAFPQSRNTGRSSDIMDDLSTLKEIATKFASWANGPNLEDVIKELRRLK